MKILDRYLFAEMIGPFMIGVIGFILVMTVDLLFTMADLIINKGVPLMAVVRLLIYKLPSILVMTFPVSTLFGTAMALGRLSKDSEIVALRTSGVSLLRIAVPLLAVGVAVSLLSYFTNEKVVPKANFIASNIIQQIIYKRPLPEIERDVFFSDAHNRHYYARQIDMKTKMMEGIMVYEVTEEKFPRVILAEKGKFKGRLWELSDGVVHRYDDKGFLNYEAAFKYMKLNVSDDVMSFSKNKTYQDMNSGELNGLIKVLDKGGVSTKGLKTELLMKYAVPATCFVFALIGIPFALPSPRAGQTWGVVVTIVFMFTFYVFASVFRSLGKGGLVPPSIAAFTPQVSFAFLGAGLLFLQNRYR